MTIENLQVGASYNMSGIIRNANYEFEQFNIEFKLVRKTVVTNTITTECISDDKFQISSKSDVMHAELLAETFSGDTLLFNHLMYYSNNKTFKAQVFWNANLGTPVSKDIIIEFKLI